jgi:hypothetical protein
MGATLSGPDPGMAVAHVALEVPLLPVFTDQPTGGVVPELPMELKDSL